MQSSVFLYEQVIRESQLDTFGHVNNSVYLTLFTEARWEMTTKNGIGLEDVLTGNEGLIVVEAHLKFRKELRLREKIVIATQCREIRKKLMVFHQEMRNEEGEVACSAEITLVVFDTLRRRMLAPSDRWLKAIGVLTKV